MTTKIDLTNIADTALTTLTGPKVTTIVYIGDDTATDTAGGATINLTGNGFQSGCSVLVASTASSVVTFISATQISFVAPALSAGTYVIYVINPDGGTAISIPGISYSGTPTWSTAAGTLGNAYETGSISATLTATGDAPITYTLATGTLPTGSTLNSNGTISGTAVATASATTYSFTITANDAQNQTTNRAFSLTINPDVVTWSSPANSTTYEVFKDSAIANVAMSATSASGQNITYTADTLPTGLSITGANIAGTPTVAASTTSTLTATASVTNRLATRTINWVVSIANDTYFKNTTLLLNGETSVTPFISDASTNSFGLTIQGDTKPVLFNPYQGDGYYSNFFDGTGDYLTATLTSKTFGTENFTAEGWFYPTALSTYHTLMAQRNTGNSTTGWIVGLDSVGGVYAYSNGFLIGAIGTASKNAWNHIAFVRSSGTMTLYLNGVSLGTSATSKTFSDTLTGVGGDGTDVYVLTGYASNIRYVVGTAVYTANFTPSTSPLTAISGTSLLTCQSNRFIDKSTNAFTITKAGDVTVSPAIPFTANSSYSTYGSTYFNGSTSTWVAVPINATFAFGTNNYTYEAWVYPTALPNAYNTVFCNFRDDEANKGWSLLITSGGLVHVNNQGTYNNSTTAISLNTWTHIAVCRVGNTVTRYINGVADATTLTVTASITNVAAQGITLGGSPEHPSARAWTGYISNARVISGTALYTTTFTPPTSPLTAVANTSLLTLQYNGGATNQAIIDNSNFNNIITRNGNTSQGTFSPYSVTGWSNYFDGTGDYLTIPSSANFTFPADFTIECWIYVLSISNTIQRIFSSNAGPTGACYFSVGNDIGTGAGAGKLCASGHLVSPYTAGFITAPTAIPINTWIHAALVRSGSTITIYQNGVSVASATDSATWDFNNSAGVRISGTPWAGTSEDFGGYITNLRIVKGTALYTSTFTPSTTPLTAIANTSLLICQSNRLIDNSVNNFTLTRAGDVSVQAFGPFGSVPEATPISYSNYFDGTGDYLTLASNTAFNIFNGDMTVECWFYATALANSPHIFAFVQDASNRESIYFNSSALTFYSTSGAGSGNRIATSALSLNTWYHMALVKSSTTFTLYLNGTSVGTSTTTQYSTSNQSLQIGTYSSGGYAGDNFNGYISNLRVVKGTAVYTTTFTPSTTPLTAITNTSLLTCQSTRMIDNSTNAFTITASGDTKPRIFNPFGYTAQTYTSYTPSLHGGSAYFDGTGDYLSVPTSSPLVLSGGVWTIECWCYLTSSSFSTYRILINKRSGSSAASYDLYFNITNGYLSFYNGTNYSSTTVPNIGVWNHIAAVYDGTNINLFMNGVRVLQTATTNPDNGGNLYIGADENGTSNFFIGYISDVRIIKGTALYTSSFIPPTTSVTSTNNTVLLLNFNNGGIVDQHSTNVLETVGNAQLSTAVKKYNNASMYFDGTGDYLILSPNAAVLNAFGTGDFTVEFWMNSVSFANADNIKIVFDCRPLSTDGLYPTIYFSSGQIRYYVNSADRITGSTLNTGQWYHVALTRSGSSTKLFVDGTQVGSTYTDTNNYLCGANRPIIASRGHTLGDNNYNGYIDDLRITKGYARYTTTFTPPTSALITK